MSPTGEGYQETEVPGRIVKAGQNHTYVSGYPMGSHLVVMRGHKCKDA